MDDQATPPERLERLEDEERRISKRRSQLHDRIRFAQTMGDGAGNPISPERLAELDAQERELSAARKELHRKIDELREQRDV